MENIKQLLELNTEIEGLLRVAEYRESEIVISLLLAKSKSFLEILNAATKDGKSYPDSPVTVNSIPTPQVVTNTIVGDLVSDSNIIETNFDVQKTENHDDINDVTKDIPDEMSEEIETVLEMETHVPEIQKKPSGEIQTSSGADPAMIIKDEEMGNIMESHDQPSSTIPTPDSNHVMRLDEMIQRQSSRDLKKAFSLNDRFRYIREIFGNDANFFDDTIKNLDTLSNLDDVYDYLLGDIGLNHEDETVKDFLAIIYNHFNA